MTTAVALIRGINVGSQRSLPMVVLRECCEKVGMISPRTYIQSGNVVFQWKGRLPAALAARLSDEIESRRNFRPSIVLRTADELAAVIASNPFSVRAATDPSKLLVMFLEDNPHEEARFAINTVKRGREVLHLTSRELYIDFPDGIGQSRLSLSAIEKALGTPATARNWNTTSRLLEMCTGE